MNLELCDQLHRISMTLVDLYLSTKNERRQFIREAAYSAEVAAISEIDDAKPQPTFSILCRSAATIAKDCIDRLYVSTDIEVQTVSAMRHLIEIGRSAVGCPANIKKEFDDLEETLNRKDDK